MTKKNTKSNEELYKSALECIRVLTINIAENFENGDDEVSHFLENLYDVLDEAGIV